MALKIEALFIDKASAGITKLNKTLLTNDKQIQKNAKSQKTLEANISSTIKKVAGLATGYVTLNSAYNLVIANGLAYNKELEQQTASITTLINATSSNVDSLGNLLTVQDKYTLSVQEANEALKELERINANTPNTLGQTAQIYKTLLPSMRAVGAESSDLITLTEKLSIAANAGGIEFNSLLAGVDGLATGTVLANSDLGRFLSSIGLTNEALKESDDVVKLLGDRLGEFKALDTITVATSNLTVEWQKLTGELTEDIFKAQKESIKDLTLSIKSLSSEDLQNLKNLSNSIASSLANSLSVAIRFVNSNRILVAQIQTLASNGVEAVKLVIKTVQIEYLKLTRDLRAEIVDLIGFTKAQDLGIDTNFNEQAKQIAILESELQNTKNTIIDSGREFEKYRENVLRQNDIVLNAENKFNEILKQNNEQIKERNKLTSDFGSLQVSRPTIATPEQPTTTFMTEFVAEREKEYTEQFKNLSLTRTEIEKQQYQERFDAEIQFLSNKEEAYAVYADKIKTFDKQIAEEHKQANIQKLQDENTFFAGTKVGLKGFQKDSTLAFDLGKTSFESFTTNSANALATFATGGKVTFKDFAKSIIADLARIAAQRAITGIFANIIGGIAGGAIGGAVASPTPSISSLATTTPTVNTPLTDAYFGGFATGGYTGMGNKYDVRGAVHANEYVATSDQVNRLGVGNIERFLQTGQGITNGGGNTSVNVIVNNNANGTEIQTRTEQNQEGQIDLIVDIVEKRLSEGVQQGTSNFNALLEDKFVQNLGQY